MLTIHSLCFLKGEETLPTKLTWEVGGSTSVGRRVSNHCICFGVMSSSAMDVFDSLSRHGILCVVMVS